jgi:UDP-2,3-diacylglucosamine hydrolase
MAVLFVSDLHLDAGRPAEIRRFRDFVGEHGLAADALYILGDLFEAWIGDDDPEPAYAPITTSFAMLREASVPCYFMHGNRDFLVGRRFASASGCRLLGEYETVDVAAHRVLLTHGDLLCTDDKPYLALRAVVRSSDWQREFLSKPLEERRSLAGELREKSRTEIAAKPQDIMDVNQQAVESAMREHGVRMLLHGHTHRPGIHRFPLDGAEAVRIVLGAWHGRGSFVRWDAGGFELETF